MKFGTPIHRKPTPSPPRRGSRGGFTLAEVLAALLLMAIVIPAGIEALHVASSAGEIAARKTEAARIASRVLDESIVMGTWSQSNVSGTIRENNHEYRWTLRNARWTEDAMQELTAEVTFTAHGREYSVRLSTLVNLQ
jgi:prepilin-type N-terminal cleavage/methylation domain-containing protein